MLELKEADDAYDRLREAVLAYLSECDNPVPDALHRRSLRNHLREIAGAPAEPGPQYRSARAEAAARRRDRS